MSTASWFHFIFSQQGPRKTTQNQIAKPRNAIGKPKINIQVGAQCHKTANNKTERNKGNATEKGKQPKNIRTLKHQCKNQRRKQRHRQNK